MEYLALALLLIGCLGYKLGWVGSLIWLALCGVAVAMVHEANKGGGCDGGLCILPYVFFLPPIWLGLWLVVFLVRRAVRKAAAAEAAVPPAKAHPR
ncbi:MAG: hypothetical protein EOO62_14945 [Hymenobacter sp.]|nr:MAG: hypothetical protein EOO62_14945 [Hymenobacter sp.]